MNTTTTPATPQLSKKELAVIRQRRYREKLKAGAVIDGSNNDLEQYKATNTEYMKKYRASKKPINTAEIDLNISLVKKNIITDTITKPNIKIKVSPLWKSSNNPNIETSTKLKGYTTEAIENMMKKINIVMVKVLNITPSPDLLRVIKTLLLGHDIRGDIKYIKKEMSFLSEKNILSFANNIRSHYPNNNSFKTYILPFVNILARLTEGYGKEYQILSKIASDSNDEYVKIRNDNEITEEEAKRLIDFNPLKIKEKLNSISTINPRTGKNKYGLININEEFLFSVYTLLIPRRLEFANVIIRNTENEADKDKNVLVYDKKDIKKSKFIFNDYKTFSSFGTQTIENMDEDFLEMLFYYIDSNEIKYNEYLFKSSKNTNKPITEGTLGDRITTLFSKIYKSDITLRYIRMSYATYKNTLNLSNNEIKKIADAMGHSMETHSQYIKKYISN
jgi:hypothetical protein